MLNELPLDAAALDLLREQSRTSVTYNEGNTYSLQFELSPEEYATLDAQARANAEAAGYAAGVNEERERCVQACIDEAVDGGVSSEDAAYNTAISDCVSAIRSLGKE